MSARNDGLTDDERRFLNKSTAMRTHRRKMREEDEAHRDRKPRLPVTAMSIILVLGILVAAIVYFVMNSFEPYTGMASTLGATLGSNGEMGEVVDQARFVESIYQWRNGGLAITIVTTLVIELILYLQWMVRMNAWEERRRARRQARKKRDRRRRARKEQENDE